MGLPQSSTSVAFESRLFRNGAICQKSKTSIGTFSVYFPPNLATQLWDIGLHPPWKRVRTICWIINNSAVDCPILLQKVGTMVHEPRDYSPERLRERSASSGHAAVIATSFSINKMCKYFYVGLWFSIWNSGHSRCKTTLPMCIHSSSA